MKIGILGTGIVARTLGGRMAELGHEIVLGTRDVDALLARTEPDADGHPPFSEWLSDQPNITTMPFDEAAIHGEIVFNATAGTASIDALQAAGEPNLAEKILVDLANPLDFSGGFPPVLSVSNGDSLGEQIQREFPRAKVVKTLNTINSDLMVDPGELAGGEHTMFVCGDDEEAKKRVTEILEDWFGWNDVIDLGDITNSRATEMLLPMWLRLYGKFGTPHVAFRVVR
ncbi:MAG: NAD(P)-binding domain-containing protein [Thermoanaerobaculia bacterium]|nr:NAD(P)-binding domain-containing protein [Thermoanaerobaculia bacterium]